jgi:hypothetical protein
MKRYCVQMTEVHQQDMFIDAETSEEAIKKVENGEGIEGELHYDYTLESDEWNVFSD